MPRLCFPQPRLPASSAVGAFLWSRALMWSAAYAGLMYLPLRIAGDGAPRNFLTEWLTRWDGGWYLSIVQTGYAFTPGQACNVAFFPLFPMLWGGLIQLGLDPPWAAALLSHAAFLVALGLLHAWVRQRDPNPVSAERTLWLLALQPAAVFFSIAYTESLFLCLSVGACLAAEKRHWVWAGLCAGLASATRVTGVLLWGLLLLLWFEQQGLRGRDLLRVEGWRRLLRAAGADWRALFWIQAAWTGLGGYMLYLALRFGEPLAFVQTQVGWGREFRAPWETLYRGVKWMAKIDWSAGERSARRIEHPVAIVDITLSVAALVGVVWLWRRLSPAYALYVLLALLIPLSSLTMSMNRYVGVLFPLYLGLAALTQRWTWLWPGLLVASAGAATTHAVLFALGYFVG